jgi:DNA processing protein
MSSPVSEEELRALLRLQLVSGLGPERTRALVEHFGSACRVLHASRDELLQVEHIGPKLAASLPRSLPGVDIQAELDRMKQHETTILVRGRPGYPPHLNTIADPPTLLYVRGQIQDEDSRAVALVGSRHCTEYGRRVARKLAQGLALAGYTVVSGLARGIDGEAHRGALEAGGRTLAVLAGGLSSIYPPEHRDLAREVSKKGALLTESSMLQAPLAGLFHSRNRIISGLSQAIVVVEAARQSGTLITARHAGEQGRCVLAVPGPIESDASDGTHELIRTGAILCRGVEDILEELHGVSTMYQRAAGQATSVDQPAPSPPVPIPSGPPPGLDATQLKIWEALSEGPRSLDELVQTLELSVATLSPLLLMLEMKKAIRRLPGNRYERQ